MRTLLLMTVLLGLLLTLSLSLESWEGFAAAKRALQSPAVPGPMLDRGSFGRVLKRLELVTALPNDESVFPKTGEQKDGLGDGVFQRKRVVGDLLYQALPRRGGDMPSTRIFKDESPTHRLPVLSIVVDDESLHDEKTGIVSRYGGRGRNWERLSHVSYLEAGKLRFASAAGIRLHGGGTRREENESFRLYFRRTLGVSDLPSNVLWEDTSFPIKTLVVRKHWYGGHVFTMAVAHELAAKMGAQVGRVKLAEFYLNGVHQGIYSLTEHVSPRQWSVHLNPPDRDAHDHFRYRSTNDHEAVLAYHELTVWSILLRDDCSLDEAEARLDLDAFIRHLFVFIFCGTTDWRQGMAVREKAPGARWSWVTWDLDHSFRDVHVSHSKEREPWEQPGLALVVTGQRWDRYKPPFPWQTQDARTRIMRTLLLESSEFRQRFAETAMDVMNHEIPPPYLRDLAQRSIDLATDLNQMDPMLEALPRFFERRPDFIRESFREFLGLGRVVTLRVAGTPGLSVLIDGYEETLPYLGYYFSGREVTLEAVAGDPPLSWHVGGSRNEATGMAWTAQQDALVRVSSLE